MLLNYSLEDLPGYIWWNGDFIPWKDAKAHISQHSLHYAGAVFEGIRIYNSRPFKLREHYERLLKSANYMGYDIPYDVEDLSQATLKIIDDNNLTRGYIRPFAWRGGEDIKMSGAGCKIHTAIIAYDHLSLHNKESEDSNAVHLEVSRWEKISSKSVPCQSKASGLYMMATIVFNEAASNGFDDAIMLDSHGHITEATTSNFFFIKHDKLYTPIPDSFLNGITRQAVIEIAHVLQKEVIEGKFTIDDLKDADAAFLTGTAIGIVKVASIYDAKISNKIIFDTGNNFMNDIITSYHKMVGVI